LQQLLAHRFARQLQRMGKLRDRGWALPFESKQDGPAAVRKLVDGDDGLAPLATASLRGKPEGNIEVRSRDCQVPGCKSFMFV
jgi:hypothetical protein